MFCDGDFWHGFNYGMGKKQLKGFWRDKIGRNMRRDKSVSRKIRHDGYAVIRLWEHDIEKRPEVCMNKIIRFMR